MFEKEAEEIMRQNGCRTHSGNFIQADKVCELIQKGAELGYNKAKAEIQEKLKADLIADLKERMQYSTSPSCTKGMELFIRSIEEWEIKEIVLPKESE